MMKFGENQVQYEVYEWDSTWLDCANDLPHERVLYIGDSISCGTRRAATAYANEKLLFDGFGTSKALDHPYYKDALHLFAMQEGQRSAVIFNNGLHGWHLEDEAEYPHYYEEMVGFLQKEFPQTPILIALTTHVANPKTEERVLRRNRVALQIAGKYGLDVIDLYAVSLANADLQAEDGIHFSTLGYEKLAQALVDETQKVLENTKENA